MAYRIALFLSLALGAFGKTATLDGKDVYYEVSGSGRETLVLIHGWTCDHTFWDAQVTPFATRYKVVSSTCPATARALLQPTIR